MRALFAAIPLGALMLWRRQWQCPQKREIFALVYSGILLCLHWLSFFAAVQWAGVAIATLTFAAFPLFTILLEAFIAKRRPKGLELLAGLAIIVAVGLLVDFGHSNAQQLLGAGMGLVSAVTFGCLVLAAKRLTAHCHHLRFHFYKILSCFWHFPSSCLRPHRCQASQPIGCG